MNVPTGMDNPKGVIIAMPQIPKRFLMRMILLFPLVKIFGCSWLLKYFSLALCHHFINRSLTFVNTIAPVIPPDQITAITFQKLKSNKATADGTDTLPKPKKLVTKTGNIFQNSSKTEVK